MMGRMNQSCYGGKSGRAICTIPWRWYSSCWCILAALITAAVVLFLIAYVLITGVPHIHKELFAWDWTTENQSMMPALVNTLVMTLLSLLIAVPICVSSRNLHCGICKEGQTTRRSHQTYDRNIPGNSIHCIWTFRNVILYVTTCGCGFSILAGALTLAIMVLPLIMRSTEEALKAVPDSYREGSFGLGAGKLRTVFRIVLPSAVPGILAGVILAIGRIVGETAALIYTAGTVAKVPSSVFGLPDAVPVYQNPVGSYVQLIQ